MTFCFKVLMLTPLVFLGCSNQKSVVETDPDLGYTTSYTIDSRTGKHHGPYVKADSTGQMLEKGNFHQGQPDGVRELYYPDGKVKIRERYKMGRIDDLYEYFFPAGTLELKGYYIDGAMYGIWKKFSVEGHLLEEVTMVDNEEMGPFRDYHPNGRLQAEGTYLHGPNEDGTLKLYDDSGQLQKEMFCDSGRCYTTWQKK